MTTIDLKDTGCKPQAHGQSAPGGGPCPRCSRPRCCATAKSRDGERCRKNPHPGATICTNHGLTEAGRAKAEQNRQLAYAQEQAATLGRPRDVDPHTALLEELHDAAGEVAWLGEVVRALDAGDVVWGRVEVKTDGEVHRAGVNVWVQLWHAARDRKLKAADRCVNAGIEERRVRLAEQAGAQLAGVVRSVVEALYAVLVEVLGPHEAARRAFEAVWSSAVLEIVPRELRRLGNPEDEQP